MFGEKRGSSQILYIICGLSSHISLHQLFNMEPTIERPFRSGSFTPQSWSWGSTTLEEPIDLARSPCVDSQPKPKFAISRLCFDSMNRNSSDFFRRISVWTLCQIQSYGSSETQSLTPTSLPHAGRLVIIN